MLSHLGRIYVDTVRYTVRVLFVGRNPTQVSALESAIWSLVNATVPCVPPCSFDIVAA